MVQRIAIIQGHPDPSPERLLRAMSESYRDGALGSGREVRVIDLARLDVPLLRTQSEFEGGSVPEAVKNAQSDLRWAEHWTFFFPLWHGTMPALVKAFLEQAFRPGFAMDYSATGFPKRLLAGRSARIVVTMGMPVLLYRLYFGALGVRGFERSVLSFAGLKPVRESFYGLTGSDEKRRARWIDDMRRLGASGR